MKPMIILVAVVIMGCVGAARAEFVGPINRQVSTTGGVGSTATDAVSPAVAFDEINQRYLLVWSADETDGEFRIMGQLMTGGSGAAIGPVFAIGTAPAGTDQRQPAVAFAPEHEQYLVVWSGDDLVPGAREIMGQMVGSDGQLVGSARRYSDMGSNDADTTFDAITPDLAWSAFLGSFIVVWAADDDAGDLTDDRFEVYGQLVKGSSGSEGGTNDFRITFSLADDQKNDVLDPAVAVIPGTDRWYVAFEVDILDDLVHDSEIWAYGCSSDLPDDFGLPISAMGGDYFDGLSARHPDFVWVPSTGELVCVWDGQDGSTKSPAIFGQRLLPDGSPVGVMMNLSTGPGTIWGDLREATHPAITLDPGTDDWFVAWRGDLDDGIAHHDSEVWGRRFDSIGTPVDLTANVLSFMDPVLQPVAGAGPPAVAVNSILGYKMVAWSGDLSTTAGDEHEIFAQSWSNDALSAAGDVPTTAFALHGATPNPFNPTTTIAFDLPAASPVSLRIYDASGRLVRTLMADEPGLAGPNEVMWNGRDDHGRQAASGVYLYMLKAGTNRDQGRMTLVK